MIAYIRLSSINHPLKKIIIAILRCILHRWELSHSLSDATDKICIILCCAVLAKLKNSFALSSAMLFLFTLHKVHSKFARGHSFFLWINPRTLSPSSLHPLIITLTTAISPCYAWCKINRWSQNWMRKKITLFRN